MMKQKLGKQGYESKPSWLKQFGLGLAAAVIVMLLLAGIIFYQYRKNPEALAGMHRFTHSFEHWLAERKTHLQANLNQRVDRVKTAVREAERNEPVHYEFYSALPNMQIGSNVHPEEARSAVSKGEEARSAVSKGDEARSKSKKLAANKRKEASIDNMLFNQEDIDQDFEETLQQKSRG